MRADDPILPRHARRRPRGTCPDPFRRIKPRPSREVRSAGAGCLQLVSVDLSSHHRWRVAHYARSCGICSNSVGRCCWRADLSQIRALGTVGANSRPRPGSAHCGPSDPSTIHTRKSTSSGSNCRAQALGRADPVHSVPRDAHLVQTGAAPPSRGAGWRGAGSAGSTDRAEPGGSYLSWPRRPRGSPECPLGCRGPSSRRWSASEGRCPWRRQASRG